MKTQSLSAPNKRGSVLLVTMLLCAILGISMVSYLLVVRSHNLTVARSLAWNKALVVAEAGVDEALALLNKGATIGSILNDQRWTATTTNIILRSPNGPAFAPLINQFAGSYYTVTIEKKPNPVITVTSVVPGPLGSPDLSRTLRVVAKPKASFPINGPMIVLSSFGANGNNIWTDSFDSSQTNLFPGGYYNTANARDKGDVISLSTNYHAIDIGNANIAGHVRTPPGGIKDYTATVGSQGAVGDKNFVNTSSGWQDNTRFKDDFTDDIDPVVLPNVTWYAPPMNISVGGKTYTYVLNSATPTYRIPGAGDITSTDTIYVQSPNTVLYVPGNVSISTSNFVLAAGASVDLYVAGASTTISGKGVVNGSGQAEKFTYYGLPSNTSINFNGNASYTGSIKAPNADFKLGGGGASVYDFVGACITKSTTMNGHFKFHYDERLIFKTSPAGYDPISWDEL